MSFPSTGPCTACSCNYSKSQIAIEYSYRFRERFAKSYVLWISAITTESVIQSYREIARRLQLPGHNVPEADVCQIVTDWLRPERGRLGSPRPPDNWLLIIDNIDSQSVLERPLIATSEAAPEQYNGQSKTLFECLPTKLEANQQMLITSRSHDVATTLPHNPECISVNLLEPAESLRLLRSRLPATVRWDEEIVKARELVDVLGHLPLAITQAAAYMSRNHLSQGQYLRILQQGDHHIHDYLAIDVQDPRRGPGASGSAFETLRLSFQEIENSSPQAARLLSTLSMLNDKEIPQDIFSEDTTWGEAAFRPALGTLLVYSLVTVTDESNTITIHSLVAAAFRHWLKQEDRFEQEAERALQTVAMGFALPHQFDEDFDDLLAANRRSAALAPHAIALLKRTDTICSGRRDILSSLSCWEAQQYRGIPALNHAQEAYNLQRKLTTTYSAQSLKCSCQVAICLATLERNDEALKWHRQALEDHGNILATDDPQMLDAMSLLAGLINSVQPQSAVALGICQDIVNAKTGKFGACHRITLAELRCLGYQYSSMRRIDQAISTFRTVFTGFKELYGPNHMVTLKARTLLHGELARKGDRSSPIAAYRQLLEAWESRGAFLMGLNTAWALADALRYEYAYEEAIPLLRKTSEAYDRLRTKSHRSARSVRSLLFQVEKEVIGFEAWIRADLLRGQRRYAEAVAFYDCALSRVPAITMDHKPSEVSDACYADGKDAYHQFTETAIEPALPFPWSGSRTREGDWSFFNHRTGVTASIHPSVSALLEGPTKAAELEMEAFEIDEPGLRLLRNLKIDNSCRKIHGFLKRRLPSLVSSGLRI